MNELQIFNNSEFGEIRTITKDNEVLFCLGDLCRALELTAKGVKQRLYDEVISNYPIADSLGRMQNAIFVNEDGLYDVILDSRKENARKFRKWVTGEVLPSIRKTGSYQKQLSPQEIMRIQLGMIDDHEERLVDLENNMTIDYGQQRVLEDTVNATVIEVLGGKSSNAYHEIGKKVFAECNRDLKNYFNVNARNNVPKKRFDEAVEYAKNWKPCTNTLMMIKECNAQICIA